MIGQLRTVLGSLRAEGRGPILLTVSFGWLLAFGVRLIFPALLPYIRDEFGLGLTTAGVLLTVLWVAYAIGQVPGGVLSDRYGPRNTLVASALLTGIGLLALSLAIDVWMFFAATLLTGIGSGVFAPARYTVLSDVYADLASTAHGITEAAGNLGATVLPILAGTLATYLTWQFGFGFLIPLFALIVAGLWVTVPRRTAAVSVDRSRSWLESVRHVFRGVLRRPTLLAAGAMLCMSVLYQSLTGFYPTYLVSVKGLDEGTAATLFGLFFAVAVVIQPAIGLVSDRVGYVPVLVTVIAATVVGIVALPVTSGPLPLAGLTVILGLQQGFWPVVHAHVLTHLPAEIQGSGLGLIRTVFILIAASGPTFTGAIADASSFDGAFLVLAGFGAVAALLCLFLPPAANE